MGSVHHFRYQIIISVMHIFKIDKTDISATLSVKLREGKDISVTLSVKLQIPHIGLIGPHQYSVAEMENEVGSKKIQTVSTVDAKNQLVNWNLKRKFKFIFFISIFHLILNFHNLFFCLQYISLFLGENSAINFMLETHYFFILERILLKHANYILKLNDEFKVQHYLKENEEVMKLKINQLKTKDVYFKIKQILYELYCFSFCNANILKLSDAICISSFTE